MGLGLTTIEQRVLAGSDFDGTLPGTTATRGDSFVAAYPADTKGGLFDFALDAPVFVRAVELMLSGQSAWTVHKRDRDGTEMLVICGTSETSFVTTERDSFVLMAKQKLVVRTTGATGALTCRISVQSPV